MALRFHPEARAELDSARRRYRVVNPDTARHFAAEMLDILGRMSSSFMFGKAQPSCWPSPIAGAGRATGHVGSKRSGGLGHHAAVPPSALVRSRSRLSSFR